jgi:hypothetical protein
MAFTAGPSKHLCQRCSDRKARFRFRGAVRADRHHTLCFECFRSERERLRSRLLAEIPAATPLRASLPSASPDPRVSPDLDQRASPVSDSLSGFLGSRPVHLRPAQVSHRLRMLAHLERSAR